MSLFRPFAELNDALAATTKKLEKRALIADYLRSLPVQDAGRAALWFSGTPFAETDPRVLNIGGSLLSKALAQLTGADPHAMSAAYRRHGDLGAAAADLLSKRQASPAPAHPALTLADVESAFAALAEARGPAAKLQLLLELLARATPIEAKYLLKLATGDMRTGVKQALVEEAIAQAWPPPPDNHSVVEAPKPSTAGVNLPKASAPPARPSAPPAAPAAVLASARRAGMLLGDLREVVALAAAHRLDQARMKLFHPIGFMLASPVESVDDAIARFTEEIAAEQATGAVSLPDDGQSEKVEKDQGRVSGADFSRVGSAADSALKGHDFSRADHMPDTNGALAPEVPDRALAAAQLEDKYDGIRAQLHLDGSGRVALYSRSREDLSAAFPDLVEAFASIQESAILDGEILAWNAPAARALPFSALQQRLGRKKVTAEMRRDIPAVLVVFDILYRGQELLLEQPLSERRLHLEAFATRWSPATVDFQARGQVSLFASADPEAAQPFPRLILAGATRLATAEQLDRAYTEARDRGNEGVMIKSLASTYQPGRRGLAWLKLKRELATLDVVVTGVEYGNGRRAQVLSDYTFAVRDPSAPPDDPAGQLKNVGKAYSGLTDQEIADMTEFFKAHTLWDNGHFRAVEPAVVLEVAFNNVMRSARHASGFALRFPRILRIRNDKPVEEIDTLARVEEIYNAQPDKPADDS